MVHQYAPPVNVSPFIRFSRWSFLIAGIVYGALWDMRYTSYETRMKPILKQQREEREEHLKKEKERKTQEELDSLAKLAEPKN